MKRSVFRWFLNITIAGKLYFTVGLMATLIAVELGVLVFAINTLSSVRAYVGGEGLWSKAQKDALYVLLKYARTHDEADYVKFTDFMKVSLGDRKARLELERPNPDIGVARQGFIEGRNDKADVGGMISLLRRFHGNQYIHRAIIAWTNADRYVAGFIAIGEKLHAEIISPNASADRINALLAEIDPLNEKLTPWEDEFSYSLGEGSRWLEHTVLRVLFFMALSVECIGLTLAFMVSRGIERGLNEILLSAQEVGKGNFSRKARVFSSDEIGKLAENFNKMSAELKSLQDENREVNNSLEKKVQLRTVEIESKSKELEQFAYVASHDLQEPLRTISGFADLLQKQYKGQLDENADKFLDYILQSSDRMKILIKDLLDYSRIGRERAATMTDCNKLLSEVLADLYQIIGDTGAVIEAERPLPVIHGYRTELKLLFQNLISNSIKFHGPGRRPHLHINAVRKDHHWQFLIRDNGIGIEPQFLERIFIIFQRLHTRTQYEGSGIGLAHCKKVVELHGGNIWVESIPGQGSSFYFTISQDL